MSCKHHLVADQNCLACQVSDLSSKLTVALGRIEVLEKHDDRHTTPYVTPKITWDPSHKSKFDEKPAQVKVAADPAKAFGKILDRDLDGNPVLPDAWDGRTFSGSSGSLTVESTDDLEWMPTTTVHHYIDTGETSGPYSCGGQWFGLWGPMDATTDATEVTCAKCVEWLSSTPADVAQDLTYVMLDKADRLILDGLKYCSDLKLQRSRQARLDIYNMDYDFGSVAERDFLQPLVGMSNLIGAYNDPADDVDREIASHVKSCAGLATTLKREDHE